jgi:SAM-dependent methyltransferase
MSGTQGDKVFGGSVARLYETHLVPMLFEPYAADLARRVASVSPREILELAAGTGAVTRRLAATLPESVRIVATDLNQPMLDQAIGAGTSRPVDWRQADAMELPFADGSFDTVVCQFGVMFFPDKGKAFAEAKRVLKPGGTFLFSVWDRIEENPLPEAVLAALAELFPVDSPRFMARTPHGYYDLQVLERDLAQGGFEAAPRIEKVTLRSRAESPRIAAVAFCQGTPVRNEIEALDPTKLEEATDHAEQALARRYGNGAIESQMQAFVVTVEA